MSCLAIITKALLLPVGLLHSVCEVETRNTNIVRYIDGDSPSYGVCQVKYSTASMFLKGIRPKHLMDECTNYLAAGLYLQYNKRRFGTWERAVIAYNQGNPKKAVSTKYLRKVEKLWKK